MKDIVKTFSECLCSIFPKVSMYKLRNSRTGVYYRLHSATDVMTRILSRDTASSGVKHSTTSVAYGNLLTILTLGSVMFASVKERSRF